MAKKEKKAQTEMAWHCVFIWRSLKMEVANDGERLLIELGSSQNGRPDRKDHGCISVKGVK